MMLLKSTFIICTFVHLLSAEVFLEKRDASTVLHRSRRANTGFLEELKPGNLERECIEEICDYEEAREVFENDDQTLKFWKTYHAREPCLANPCKNNATCIYTDKGYTCECLEGYEGKFCQTVFEDSLKCLYMNGGCQHFCDGSGPRRKCSCADGFALGEDGRECVAQVQFPCGQVPPDDQQSQTVQSHTRLVGGRQCPKGECPWQVLVKLHGAVHCGGVLVGSEWVITAAHCIHGNHPDNITVVAGEYDLDTNEGTEQTLAVVSATPYPQYSPESGEGDVAVLRLASPGVLPGRYAVPVCLPSDSEFVRRELAPVRFHMVSGWGRRTTGGNPAAKPDTAPTSPLMRRLSVPILSNQDCSRSSGFNFTDSMLCAGYLEGEQESCRGDDGSPLVTLYGSAHFLTGVVGWGRGCAHPGYYGVYANMAHFIDWVADTMKNAPVNP